MKAWTNVLVIAYVPPEPDQASGGLRFFTILEMLGVFGEESLSLSRLRFLIMRLWTHQKSSYLRCLNSLSSSPIQIGLCSY